MGATSYSGIKDSLRNLYLEAPVPRLVGFSGELEVPNWNLKFQ